ncbi:LacI family DNA-binding transcriptional regulator [Nonomuraea sp. NPDC005983]|uniref:LacI family DNA-binding transcriptional regulator n=1 Tax=Nonomuraea sp. NPDC005983 TaxID=3155595 RepID=UPI0033B138E3
MARLAGVSTAVVSYVLNEGPRPVAEATRRRVLDAVAELGYRPSALAKALRSQRTNLLGLVVPDCANPFFATLTKDVERAAFAAGLLTLVGNAAFDETTELAYLRAFLELDVAAVVLIDAVGTPPVRELLAGHAGRVVMLHRSLPGVRGISVVSDNRHGGRLAALHLLGHGHRAVACLTGPDRLAPVRERERGWQEALEEAGPAACGPLVRCDYSRDAAAEATLRLLDQAEPPTAIFATTDELALGALAAASSRGVPVPDRLAVVGMDGIPEAAHSHPPLTTVAQDVAGLAEQAVRAAAGRLHEPVTLPVTLIPRRTCGC